MLRNLFLLLLLANLVFAMWWLWIEPTASDETAEGESPHSAPRIVLLSEVDDMLAGEVEASEVAGLTMAAPEPLSPAPEPGDATAATDESTDPEPGETVPETDDMAAPPATEAAAAASDTGGAPPDGDDASGAADGPVGTATAEPGAVDIAAVAVEPPPPVTPAPGRCVSVGPFLNLPEATVAASRLRADGFEPRQRQAESDVWMGYWVHLPAYPSRAAAVAAVEGLRENGITDLYIEPGGELRNAVSLGIFRDRARAEAHAGRMQALDFGAVVSERYRQAQAYWIDVDVAADAPLDASGFSSTAVPAVRIVDDVCVE